MIFHKTCLAIVLAVATGFVLADTSAGTAATTLTDACAKAMSAASVDDANRVVTVKPPPDNLKDVSLGDTISVEGNGLAEFKRDCDPLPVVLYLNGHPIKSLKPYPPTPPPPPPPPPAAASPQTPPPSPPPGGGGAARSVLQYTLSVTDDSRTSWTPILGAPCCSAKSLKVSVGLEDQYSLRASTGKDLPVLKLDILANRWFVIWGLIFVAMLIVFFGFALKSNIIRDGNPAAAGATGVVGTYSLSKSQGAWWFFIILAAYLFIGIVVGDFTTSLNSTALILMGIGAGTVVGAAVIDASKQQETAAAQATQIRETKEKVDALKSEVDALDNRIKAAPADADALMVTRDAKKAEYEQQLSFYRKLTRQRENFLIDVLSDANGISFHRFQMAAWTVVLGILFVKEAYENLAMPTFSTTLMGLLGLSAGTYLGLKIPEPTAPKK